MKPNRELWPAEFFCAKCHAPKRASYRAFGARCENPKCDNENDGSRRPFWITREELAAVTTDKALLKVSPVGSDSDTEETR